MLATAYHNLAIEQEFLNEFEEAIEAYRKAKFTAEEYLGEENPLAKHMDSTYNKAKTILENHIEKIEGKIGSTRRI